MSALRLLHTSLGTHGQPLASKSGIVVDVALYLESRRVLWRAATLTIAAAVAAVLAVREVAVRIHHPNPAFTPLSLGSPIVATIGCTAMAIYVFLGTMSYPNPVRTWRRVSVVLVILSFAPCLLLAVSHIMGGGWPEAFALMTMHAVVWAICATVLPRLATTKHPGKTQPRDPLSIL
jgi:uncharacterized membrane protein